MLKVLVVEDEDLVRHALVSLTPWNDLGFEFCAQAENGAIALSLYKEYKPHLIISDIRMPVMDGLAFVQKAFHFAHEKKLFLPEVIILSGYSEFEYAQKALQLGVHEYLLKPFEDEVFYATLERAKNRILNRLEEKKDFESSLFQKLRSLDEDENDNAFHYVKKTIDLIEDRYILGIRIEDAAQEVGLSCGHLSRLFKQKTKQTFNEYLRNYRIEKAIALLKDQSLKVYEIADLVGYLDERYFTQTFKKITGFTPSEYRYHFFQEDKSTDVK